jgi:hypothetical protein
MKFARNSRSVSLLAGVLLVSNIGCGWRQVVSFSSPSGKYSVEVRQPKFWSELGMRLLLNGPRSNKVVGEFKGDAHVNFVHCWWSSDEGTVALLLAGSFRKIFAYDTATGQSLDGDWQTEIGRDIVRHYGLSASTSPADALSWALSAPGLDAFKTRYPTARTQ